MKFSDLKRKFAGEANAADPTRAFGSEREMMEALQRQEFTPPKPRATAADVVQNLRQRFVRPAAEAPQERAPRDDSAARAYAPEAMGQPEWENPFTSPTPSRPKRSTPVYETLSGRAPRYERGGYGAYAPDYAPYAAWDGFAPQGYPSYEAPDESMPQGYYAAPYPPQYPPQGYAPPAYGAPYYEPYAAAAYDPRGSVPYPPNGYSAPQTPYPPYPPQAVPSRAPEMPYAPRAGMAYASPEYAMPGDAAFYGDTIPAPEYDPAPPYAGAPQRPAAAAKPKRKPLEGADLRYLFWSGSIVSGVVLTLVAFIYACTL